MASIRLSFRSFTLAILLASALSLGSQSALASTHHRHRHAAGHHVVHGLVSRIQPASFILDADTGRILEAENPDSLRYPASLTKMMTLYLTFDALQKGRLRLDQMIPVSAHAASQPQTNIALQPNERIAVKNAILSIVIRSANDSAVTLGEALGGGSEADFARLMTATAHRLGMSRTEFRNASGLPDPDQHTTARDMATLGLALKRHFPQYFPFFKTESFSYQGKTYITHNHVMTRYEGVDGIKTGFIRAAGFNLVTSANRGGHHLVGVVLGGPTHKARDDKMIALLDRQFTQLAREEGQKGAHYASLDHMAEHPPMPRTPFRIEQNEEGQEGEGDAQGYVSHPLISETSASASLRKDWGIQLGAYAHASEAHYAAAHAANLAPQELAGSLANVTEAENGAQVHRARLVHLTQAQAESACARLSALHQSCFPYHVQN
jgi:D-alanyl-D-alanine carboxypeptidase